MKLRDSRPIIPPLEPGTYLSVCIGAVDLGKQESIYNGKTKYEDKLRIIFEIPGETIVIDGEAKPRQISRDFTQTYASNGNIRQFLGAWYGKTFSDEDIRAWDTSEILGKPAMLSVVLSKDGKYANISSAAALPKGIDAPISTSEFITFNVEYWDDNLFSKLPEYLQNKIKNSVQYRMAHLPQDEISVEAAEAAAAQAAQADEAEPVGGVPF